MDDIEAYRRTTFEAETPVGRVKIRPGDTSDRLERLLEFHDAETWAFLTAWNPGGIFADEQQNRRRQEELESDLADREFETFAGTAVPDPAEWAPEQTLLVVGIDREEALAIADDYAQDALIWGVKGEPAHLVDCETGEDVTEADGGPVPSERTELDEVLDELGGTVGESVANFRAEPPNSMENAVDWELVLRSLDDDYPDPDLD